MQCGREEKKDYNSRFKTDGKYWRWTCGERIETHVYILYTLGYIRCIHLFLASLQYIIIATSMFCESLLLCISPVVVSVRQMALGNNIDDSSVRSVYDDRSCASSAAIEMEKPARRFIMETRRATGVSVPWTCDRKSFYFLTFRRSFKRYGRNKIYERMKDCPRHFGRAPKSG